jgi:hypothetical protein
VTFIFIARDGFICHENEGNTNQGIDKHRWSSSLKKMASLRGLLGPVVSDKGKGGKDVTHLFLTFWRRDWIPFSIILAESTWRNLRIFFEARKEWMIWKFRFRTG